MELALFSSQRLSTFDPSELPLLWSVYAGQSILCTVRLDNLRVVIFPSCVSPCASSN